MPQRPEHLADGADQLTFPQVETVLKAAGFEVTIMEHDYSLLRGWDGISANAIFVACKPRG